MTRFIALTVLMTGFITLVLASPASAVPIVSNNFSLGHGYVSGSWNDSETSSVNTDVTGDFTLSVGFEPSIAFTGNPGLTFINRVLANSAQGSSQGRTDMFSVDVTATYTGSAPLGQLTLFVDEIRIWAGNHAGGSITNTDTGGQDLINWIETTVGNSGVGPIVDLGAANSDASNVANYDLVSWDPGESAVPGTTTTRLFDLQTNGQLLAYLDGFEIFGHIEFAAVPEPATHLMLIVGLVGLAKVRRGRGRATLRISA